MTNWSHLVHSGDSLVVDGQESKIEWVELVNGRLSLKLEKPLSNPEGDAKVVSPSYSVPVKIVQQSGRTVILE
jgi:hypothetical protein